VTNGRSWNARFVLPPPPKKILAQVKLFAYGRANYYHRIKDDGLRKRNCPKLDISMIGMEYQVNDLIAEYTNTSRVNYLLLSIS
jgi:hypothetical protein